jgi:Spy/CpxP family protein refolding chaperone
MLLRSNSILREERTMNSNWKNMGGIMFVAAAFLLSAALAVFSQRGGPPPGPPPGGFPGGRDVLGPIAQDLNLSDDQKAQIKKIQDSFDADTKALRDQLRTLHESQADLLSSGTFDEAAVRAAAQARANVQVELEVAHARTASQVYSVLTSEQKTQLAAKRQEMLQRRQEWDAQRKKSSVN